MRQKKRLAAEILKTSPKNVVFAQDALGDVQKAITRSDVRGLIAVGKIQKKNKSEHSRVRARKIARQKRKGRQKGKGSRKGGMYAVVSSKKQWVTRIRVQREFLKQLRDKKLLTSEQYHSLYVKSKGGFFRNRRHLKLYLTELLGREKLSSPDKKVE